MTSNIQLIKAKLREIWKINNDLLFEEKFQAARNAWDDYVFMKKKKPGSYGFGCAKFDPDDFIDFVVEEFNKDKDLLGDV